jgi:hypothetical protein
VRRPGAQPNLGPIVDIHVYIREDRKKERGPSILYTHVQVRASSKYAFEEKQSTHRGTAAVDVSFSFGLISEHADSRRWRQRERPLLAGYGLTAAAKGNQIWDIKVR